MVAIAIILASVFVPIAFVPGISGRMYQQFALTIAISVLISAFNALSLTPALCALLLRPAPKERRGPLARSFPRSTGASTPRSASTPGSPRASSARRR